MDNHDPPFSNRALEETFGTFPGAVRAQLLCLRRLIFEVAREMPGVGPVEEALKWGQPAYLTPQTRSGSTLRLGMTKANEAAIYAHCQTTIISEFQRIFPGDFRYDGTRAVLFEAGAELPVEKLRLLVAHGLTYHKK